jgi:predicted ArsR family transcriptional regulator
MFFKVVNDVAKPQWLEIIKNLKRSTGMSVNELATALGMSYMGVKQHCVELQKKGYLDTWRRPKNVGRPEKVYRLTDKARPLFPMYDNELTLEILGATDQLHGTNAAEKLLYAYFQKKGDQYSKKVKGGSVVDRASSLSRQRDKEGYVSECEFDKEGGFRMVEYHSPYSALAQKYPTVYRMEQQMLERVIGTRIDRGEEKASGLVKYVFRVKTL